jgi:hypothetical protein
VLTVCCGIDYSSFYSLSYLAFTTSILCSLNLMWVRLFLGSRWTLLLLTRLDFSFRNCVFLCFFVVICCFLTYSWNMLINAALYALSSHLIFHFTTEYQLDDCMIAECDLISMEEYFIFMYIFFFVCHFLFNWFSFPIVSFIISDSVLIVGFVRVIY